MDGGPSGQRLRGKKHLALGRPTFAAERCTAYYPLNTTATGHRQGSGEEPPDCPPPPPGNLRRPTWSNLRCFFSSVLTSCRCCSRSMMASSSSCPSCRRPRSSRSTASVFSARRRVRASTSRAARRRASSPASSAPASSSWRLRHSESWGGGGEGGWQSWLRPRCELVVPHFLEEETEAGGGK